MSTQDQIDKLIAIRAAEWYEAICAGTAETSSDEFRRWISESPKHIDAFMVVAGQAELIREVLQTLPVEVSTASRISTAPSLSTASRISTALSISTTSRTWTTPRKTSAEIRPLILPAPDRQTPDAQSGIPPTRTRTRWKRPAVWASLAAGITAIAISLWAALPQRDLLETGKGEQRLVSLADGSVVNLNAESAVEVRLRAQTRDIRLLRGEAIFKVAHDRARPFRVHTETAVVRAVGTEFAVSIRREGTTVTVLEGKVEVAPNTPPASQTPSSTTVAGPGGEKRALVMAVAAGQQARVANSGTVQFDPRANVTSSVAWLQRKLVFRQTLLEEMIPEINRYNAAIQLHIDGVPPGVYRFSGTFNANDPASLAELLGREAGLAVEHRGNDIYIKESPPKP